MREPSHYFLSEGKGEGTLILLGQPPGTTEKRGRWCRRRLLEIIYSQTTDQAVNDLVWKCLGYKKDASGEWNNDDVFPKWREKYPYPPDLIGVPALFPPLA